MFNFPALQKQLAHPFILFFIVLTLVPILFLPFGIDQCIFIRGSEVLFSGGKLYADYFEQKPPLLFVFYGLARVLFGNQDISYRFFDFLWQLFTVFSLLYCIQRLTQNKVTGIIGAIVYGILYSSMGNSEIMECESFIAPAVIWLIYLTSKQSTDTKLLFIRGGLAGFCFGMKFTFGLIFAAILLWELLEANNNKAKRFINISVGFLLVSACSFWAFFDSEVLHGYLRVLEYTRAYASIPPINIEFFRKALMNTGNFFGDNISLTLSFASAFGLGVSLKKYYNDDDNTTGRFVRICFIIFLFLLLSIIIERKFPPYHFLRLFIPFSALSAIGLSSAFTFIQTNWNSTVKSWKFTATLLCLSGLLMSPLPRFFKNIQAGYRYYSSNQNTWVTFQSLDNPARIIDDTRDISEFIRSSKKKGRTFAITTAASYIYRLLDEHPISKFSMPMYYYATVVPKGAYQEMFEEVKLSHWLVVQNNDVHPTIYGHNKSSWDCVRTDSVMYSYLNTNFNQTAEIGAFYVFERKE